MVIQIFHISNAKSNKNGNIFKKWLQTRGGFQYCVAFGIAHIHIANHPQTKKKESPQPLQNSIK